MTASSTFFAADVGNSRVKIGHFAAGADDPRALTGEMPQPSGTLLLPMRTAEERLAGGERLRTWLREVSGGTPVAWFVASVNRSHAAWLRETAQAVLPHEFHSLDYRDFPLDVRVDRPERVGVDRLAGAVAANSLRSPERAAIVVDIGTAITVDLISAAGAFEGGAILPGIAMAARALEHQTDALPRSPLTELVEPPPPVGNSTLAAIEAGLLWGTVGALRELIERMAGTCENPPQVFATGGMSPAVVPLLQSSRIGAVHVSELVLAGIAIVAQQGSEGREPSFAVGSTD